MIFPQDYKYITVTEKPPQKGEPIYFSTKYAIVKHTQTPPHTYQLYEIENTGEGLLRTITRVTLLADTHQTTLLDETVDSCNMGPLVEKAHQLCNREINTVIITAIDKHTTFIHHPDINALLEIEIIDFTPPHPPWLTHTIHRLHKTGVWSKLPIRFTQTLIDLSHFEEEHTMFPCSASGLRGAYLDTATTAHPDTILVGCDISHQIYTQRFKTEPAQHINICPLKKQLHTPSKPFITRCCQSEKTGLTTLNNTPGIIVHWGASEHDIIEAIQNLYHHCRGDA